MSGISGSMTSIPVRKTRRRYLPFNEVLAGMILSEPIRLVERQVLRFSLPAGHELTEGNLRQLAIHGAEYLCIDLPDWRSDEEVAAQAALTATKVMRIFKGADLSSPALAGLFERVLAYRSR